MIRYVLQNHAFDLELQDLRHIHLQVESSTAYLWAFGSEEKATLKCVD